LGLVKSPLTTELRALSLPAVGSMPSGRFGRRSGGCQSPKVLAMMLRWISEVPP